MERKYANIIDLPKPSSRMVNLEGMRSEMLTVNKIKGKVVYSTGSMLTIWNATCDCGNKILVDSNKFLRKELTSCGCVRAKRYIDKKRDPRKRQGELVDLRTIIDRRYGHPALKGKKLGLLTVEFLSHGTVFIVKGGCSARGCKKLVTFWNCVCQCGNRVMRGSTYLCNKRKHPHHCGCLNKNRTVKGNRNPILG